MKTIAGAIIAILAFGLKSFDVDIDEGILTETFTTALALFGLAATIYGRIKARKLYSK